MYSCWAGIGAVLGLLALPMAAEAQVATLTGNGLTQPLACGGGAADITGSGNSVLVRGACTALDILGNGNHVSADLAPGARVRVQGDNDHVLYRVVGGTAGPVVTVTGQNSAVSASLAAETDAATAPSSAATMPPPPPPASRGTLTLRGDIAAGTVDCTGKDVRIIANGGRFGLRGGCRSLRVEGDNDAVQAELAPGSPIELDGSGDVVAFLLTAPGPAPVVAAAGPGSRAYRVARLPGAATAEVGPGGIVMPRGPVAVVPAR